MKPKIVIDYERFHQCLDRPKRACEGSDPAVFARRLLSVDGKRTIFRIRIGDRAQGNQSEMSSERTRDSRITRRLYLRLRVGFDLLPVATELEG